MDKAQSEPDLTALFLEVFPPTGEPPLPIPHFGKVPPEAYQARSLPNGDSQRTAGEDQCAFSLSWIDEDDLGVRVYVKEEQGLQGSEICAYAEGIRPDLLGKGVSVALCAEKQHRMTQLTVRLDKQTPDGRAFTGEASFGATADLRKQLGERVTLDVCLIE